METQKNKESDRLAREGALKEAPDDLDLEIPKEFDLQGAKLNALTQALAYRGIKERRTPEIAPRPTETLNKQNSQSSNTMAHEK